MKDTRLVTDHIGIGKESAVTRSTLRLLTGFDDRVIRKAIENSDELIINNGKGYFKPTEDEIDEVKTYMCVMTAKAKSEIERVNQCTRWLYERT